MTEKHGDIIAHSQAPDAGVDKKPAWLRKRLDWLMSLRFGLFIHWGPYCQWDCCESWSLVPEDTWARPDHFKCWTERGKDLDRFTRDYWKLNESFNPVQFDPDAWAALAAEAGMRYIAFTTKHHDGFSMFDTAATDYRVTHPDCPFHSHSRANIAREVFDAFRAKDMAISCYFSKSDWHSPYYWSPDFPIVHRNPNFDTRNDPARWDKFVAFVHQQVEELMTQYGNIDVLWLDGGQVRAPKQDIQMAKLAAMARSHQPGLIIADRTVGGDYEDFITPEQEIPDRPLAAPWESCMTLGDYWKYVPDDQYKSAGAVIDMLVETAAKGGNLLLGIGPDPQGVIPREAANRLREVGRWLQVNGEAIYGTAPIAPYKSQDICFTTRPPYAYAIIRKLNNQRQVFVEGLAPEPGSQVNILGMADTIKWRAADRGFHVELPGHISTAEHGCVVRFIAQHSNDCDNRLA